MPKVLQNPNFNATPISMCGIDPNFLNVVKKIETYIAALKLSDSTNHKLNAIIDCNLFLEFDLKK